MKTESLFKKLIPLTLTLLAMVILSSCQKDNFPDPSTLPKGLTGSWVETNTMSDTLIFYSDNSKGLLWLQRGYEIRNGYRLPIIGSKGYSYEITEASNSIYLVDGESNAFISGTYYFKLDETNLIINIGKFSNYIETKKSTLTFRKIK